jgi:catechol 2,3-dioxygenase
MQAVAFRPRRLGHVNLWVSDLERSVDFYESICGIELVRRERDLRIAFHSNGNSHHDVGLIEVSRGRDRYGRDGTLQIPKTRGTSPGLNHLGWEMENEAQLLDAYKRAHETRYPIIRSVDHRIARSVYVSDPDGNAHEFYADQMHDWDRIFNLDQEDEVTGEWDPLAQPPGTEPNYNVDWPLRHVARAPLHPSHLTGVCFATRKLEEMLEFFTLIGGLDIVGEESKPLREVRLAGALGRADIILVEAADGEPIGLRSFSLKLAQPHVAATMPVLRGRGIEATQHGADVHVQDPDGFRIEFHHPG